MSVETAAIVLEEHTKDTEGSSALRMDEVCSFKTMETFGIEAQIWVAVKTQNLTSSSDLTFMHQIIKKMEYFITLLTVL